MSHKPRKQHFQANIWADFFISRLAGRVAETLETLESTLTALRITEIWSRGGNFCKDIFPQMIRHSDADAVTY